MHNNISTFYLILVFMICNEALNVPRKRWTGLEINEKNETMEIETETKTEKNMKLFKERLLRGDMIRNNPVGKINEKGYVA